MRAPDVSPRLLIITGEASGDRYGGLLAAALRERLPGVRLHGIGGSRMRAAGVDLLYDAHGIAVTGLLEVAGALGEVWAAWRAARSHLRRERPDAVVLIDYADFNLSFARAARRAGIPVVYFVAPQVWAWRRYRVRRIARDVDRVLVILPFEEEFYRRHGVSARFVGHPLLDLMEPPRDREEAARSLGLPAGSPVLGLLPGSRRNEIRELLPVMLDAAARVARSRPGLRLVLPLASPGHRPWVESQVRDHDPPVALVEEGLSSAVPACHATLTASGTATLEVALARVPMVIAYRVRPWTYRLVQRMSALDHAGLPNLVLGRQVVPERLQDDCRADRLADAVLPLMDDGEDRRAMLSAFADLPGALGGGGAIPRAADAIVDLLQERGVASTAA